MKSYILTVEAGTGGVTAGSFVKQDGSGGVVNNDTAGSEIGVANADKSAGEKVGVIVRGLVKLKSVAGSYNFGDKVEVDATGQAIQALSTGKQIGIIAETKTTTASDDKIWVLLNLG